jgi:hypothetical protein
LIAVQRCVIVRSGSRRSIVTRASLSAFLKAALVVLLLSSSSALADGENGKGKGHAAFRHERGSAQWVPEFDPAAAGAIAAIMVGGGVLMARRRRR